MGFRREESAYSFKRTFSTIWQAIKLRRQRETGVHPCAVIPLTDPGIRWRWFKVLCPLLAPPFLFGSSRSLSWPTSLSVPFVFWLAAVIACFAFLRYVRVVHARGFVCVRPICLPARMPRFTLRVHMHTHSGPAASVQISDQNCARAWNRLPPARGRGGTKKQQRQKEEEGAGAAFFSFECDENSPRAAVRCLEALILEITQLAAPSRGGGDGRSRAAATGAAAVVFRDLAAALWSRILHAVSRALARSLSTSRLPYRRFYRVSCTL